MNNQLRPLPVGIKPCAGYDTTAKEGTASGCGGWRKTRLSPLAGDAGLETGGRGRRAAACRRQFGNSAPLMNNQLRLLVGTKPCAAIDTTAK
jgi:hypothetical protein